MMTDGTMMTEAFSQYLYENTNLRDSSIKTYLSVISQFDNPDPTIQDCNAFLNRLYRDTGGANHAYYALKHYLKFLSVDGIQGLVKPPTSNPKPRKPIPDNVLSKMHEYMVRPFSVIFRLQNFTGARAIEVLLLRQELVDWDKIGSWGKVTYVMKGGRQREVDVPPPVFLLLQEYYDPRATFVFFPQYSGLRGVELWNKYRSLYRSYQRIIKRAALSCGYKGEIASHDIRRTFAKELLAVAKGNISLVSEQLGHKYLNTTMRYVTGDSRATREKLVQLQKSKL